MNNFNCLAAKPALLVITIPQGTFARLSNLIAGGRSILRRLERAGGSRVLPQNVWRTLMVLRLTNCSSSMRFGPYRLRSPPVHLRAPDEGGLFGRRRWIRPQSIRRLPMALPQKDVGARKIVPLT